MADAPIMVDAVLVREQKQADKGLPSRNESDGGHGVYRLVSLRLDHPAPPHHLKQPVTMVAVNTVMIIVVAVVTMDMETFQ